MAKRKFAPRGMRNNNPLNIRRGKTPWIGEVQYIERVATDKSGNECKTREYDRSFCQFSELKYGWRAAFKLINKYIEVYKCDTIRKIITRWAPPTENNTSNYVKHVCAWQNLDADAKITTDNHDVLIPIVIGMMMVENGWEYDPSLHLDLYKGIREGFEMVFGG